MNFKSLIYIVLAMFCLFSCKNKKTETSDCKNNSVIQQQMSEKDSLCVEYQNVATADIQNGSMKYYNFGQLPPDSAWLAKFKKYNVKVITKNCVLVPELLCYNKIILMNIEKLQNEQAKTNR